MSYPEFELFLGGTKSFLEGERLLIENGPLSIPKLEAFFSGEAKNEFGAEYRTLGQAMTCALETACRLGSQAKPLETHLRRVLATGNHTAAMALGALGSLAQESVVALASAMLATSGPRYIDLAFESATALIKCGRASDPSFLAARAKLPENSFLEKAIARRIEKESGH